MPINPFSIVSAYMHKLEGPLQKKINGLLKNPEKYTKCRDLKVLIVYEV